MPLVYLFNHLDSVKPQSFSPYIASAQITCNQDIIDITDVCSRNLLSNTSAVGRSTMTFDASFCQILQNIWLDFMQSDSRFRDICKFKINLQVMELNRRRNYVVECRISHDPVFQIFSKTADLTFDDNKISEDNLLPAPAFELALAQSPLHYLFIPVPNLQAFKLKNSSLLLKYGPKGQPSAMEVKINFEDNQEHRVACAVTAWKFSAPDESTPKFEKNQHSFVFDVGCFFLTVEELLDTVAARVLVSVSDSDIIKFIRYNKANKQVTTSADKLVDLASYVFLLPEWDKARATASPIVLSVNPR